MSDPYENAGEAGSNTAPDDISFRQAAPLLEWMCWVVLMLAPFLRWVNGPAVSTDQFVVQIALVCVALLGAISLRIYNYRISRQPPCPGNSGTSV